MNSRTIQDLQFFIGKVCSVVTTSMNRSFDEMVSREHFVIRIQIINADGIWGVHPYNKDLVSFFALPHIISIHQEVELDLDNPEHAAMIKEYEEKTGKKLKADFDSRNNEQTKKEKEDLLPVIEDVDLLKHSDADQVGDSTFVNIANLESLAEQSKRTFDAQDAILKQRN
jgi:hypothetical protein